MEQENRLQAVRQDTVQNDSGIQTGSATVSRKTDFIPNPLPGPKPHVKKEMKYDYEVPPEKLFFDIEKPERMFYDYD